jgi:hypothetical protein
MLKQHQRHHARAACAWDMRAAALGPFPCVHACMMRHPSLRHIEIHAGTGVMLFRQRQCHALSSCRVSACAGWLGLCWMLCDRRAADLPCLILCCSCALRSLAATTRWVCGTWLMVMVGAPLPDGAPQPMQPYAHPMPHARQPMQHITAQHVPAAGSAHAATESDGRGLRTVPSRLCLLLLMHADGRPTARR